MATLFKNVRIYDSWTQIHSGWIRSDIQLEVAEFISPESVEPETVPRIIPHKIRTKVYVKGNNYCVKVRCLPGRVASMEYLDA